MTTYHVHATVCGCHLYDFVSQAGESLFNPDQEHVYYCSCAQSFCLEHQPQFGITASFLESMKGLLPEGMSSFEEYSHFHLGDLAEALPSSAMEINSEIYMVGSVAAEGNTDISPNVETGMGLDLEPCNEPAVFGPLSVALSIRTKDGQVNSASDRFEAGEGRASFGSCPNSFKHDGQVKEKASVSEQEIYHHATRPTPTAQPPTNTAPKPIVLVRREKPRMRTDDAVLALAQSMEGLSHGTPLKPVFLESQGKLWL